MIAGAIMSGWISFGTQVAVASGAIAPHKLNMSITGCVYGNVSSSLDSTVFDESDVFPLHRLSFLWINPIGILSVLVVGTIASYVSGARDLSKIDPDLISPVIHRFLPGECFQKNRNESDPIATELVNLEINDHHHVSHRTPSPD